MNQKKALLLIGSPKAKNSTSEALGSYLLDKLQHKGFAAKTYRANLILRNDLEEFLNELEAADAVIISFPLFIDGLPAPLTRAIELIAEKRDISKLQKEQSLSVIVNGGYPEAYQNETAIRICKVFAERNGFKWFGGLAMGEGPLLLGRKVEEKGLTKKAAKALNMAADAIAAGEIIPSEAAKMMAKAKLPKWAYIAFCSQGWNYLAKPHNTQKLLCAKEYKAE